MGNLATSARSTPTAGARPRTGAAAAALAAALVVAGAVASLLAPRGVAAAPGDGGSFERPLRALGDATLATLGAAGADRALRALGDSLALASARDRLEREPPAADGDGEDAAPGPPPEPGYGSRAGKHRFRLVNGVAADPSELPPASAGSNGTAAPRSPAHLREKMFARKPGGDPETTSILLTGIALPPPAAPEEVKGVINNANRIIGRPYVWGGGHESFYSHGYDCSGAVSFALFGGGLIPRPLTSGELMRWGEPGPGKWITVYANPGHTYAMIAGLRFDTSGVQNGTGPRWHLRPRSPAAFVARHPPGL